MCSALFLPIVCVCVCVCKCFCCRQVWFANCNSISVYVSTNVIHGTWCVVCGANVAMRENTFTIFIYMWTVETIRICTMPVSWIKPYSVHWILDESYADVYCYKYTSLKKGKAVTRIRIYIQTKTHTDRSVHMYIHGDHWFIFMNLMFRLCERLCVHCDLYHLNDLRRQTGRFFHTHLSISGIMHVCFSHSKECIKTCLIYKQSRLMHAYGCAGWIQNAKIEKDQLNRETKKHTLPQ